MRTRIVGPVVILALLMAACGGDEAGGTSGTTGATSSTGATGATGSAEIAAFTVVVQDPQGGNTLSFSGESCDGFDGPYTVTIAAEGNVTGETTATFSVDESGASTMDWSMDVSGADGQGTLSGSYAIQISPVQDSQVLVFTGITTAEGPSGTRTFDVATDDVQVQEGTGACDASS